jgi:hypothetical protein
MVTFNPEFQVWNVIFLCKFEWHNLFSLPLRRTHRFYDSLHSGKEIPRQTTTLPWESGHFCAFGTYGPPETPGTQMVPRFKTQLAIENWVLTGWIETARSCLTSISLSIDSLVFPYCFLFSEYRARIRVVNNRISGTQITRFDSRDR